MEETVLQRIKMILKNNRMSIRGFSDAHDLKHRTVNNQLNGTSPLTIDTFLSVIKAFPEISADWLLLGKGPMLRSGSGVTQSNVSGDNIQGSGITINKMQQQFIDALQEKDKQISKLIDLLQKQN